MKGKFLSVIAVYDENTQKKLSQIQKKLRDEGFGGKLTKEIAPYITLGTFPVEEEEYLLQKLEKVSRNFEKFELALNSVGLFGMEVLFIAPAVNHMLLNLQAQFNNNYADGFGWTAHTTMLVDDPDSIRKAIPIVAKKFESHVATVEGIALYEFWPTRFVAERKLELK